MKLEVARPLGMSMVLVGAFMFVVPFVNVAPEIWPPNPGDRDWRFGALGFWLGALTMPTLGLALVVLGGVLRSSRRTLVGVGLVAGAMAVLVFIALAVFLVDGMALKGLVTDPRVMPAYNQGITRVLIISLLAVPALFVLARGASKSNAVLKQESAEQAEEKLFVRAP